MTARLKLSNADKATIIFFSETLLMSQREIATAMMTSRTSVQRVLKDGAYSPEIQKELIKLQAPYREINDRVWRVREELYNRIHGDYFL